VRAPLGGGFDAISEQQADARIGLLEMVEDAFDVGAGGAGPDQAIHDLASSALCSFVRAAPSTSTLS
jgi:hypothetical protein